MLTHWSNDILFIKLQKISNCWIYLIHSRDLRHFIQEQSTHIAHTHLYFSVRQVVFRNSTPYFLQDIQSSVLLVAFLFCLGSLSCGKLSNHCGWKFVNNVVHARASTMFSSCKHSLLYVSTDHLHLFWLQFEPKTSYLDSSLHKTCCNWF